MNFLWKYSSWVYSFCSRKSQGTGRQGSGDAVYKAASCEESEEEADLEKTGHVTVNNINLTININIENNGSRGDDSDASTGDRHFVVTEENSKKLLNLVQSVITQNAK